MVYCTRGRRGVSFFTTRKRAPTPSAPAADRPLQYQPSDSTTGATRAARLALPPSRCHRGGRARRGVSAGSETRRTHPVSLQNAPGLDDVAAEQLLLAQLADCCSSSRADRRREPEDRETALARREDLGVVEHRVWTPREARERGVVSGERERSAEEEETRLVLTVSPGCDLR